MLETLKFFFVSAALILAPTALYDKDVTFATFSVAFALGALAVHLLKTALKIVDDNSNGVL